MSRSARSSPAASDGAIAVAISASRDRRRLPKDAYIKDVDFITAPTAAMDPEETLARWRAEEAAMRARLQMAPGVAPPAQVAGRSGLQIFQALLAGEIPPRPMA